MPSSRALCALAACLCAMGLAGCVNSFETYYTPVPEAEQILASPYAAAPPRTPKIYQHSASMQADAQRLMENGYVLLGTSSFDIPANQIHRSQLLREGKTVHASLIMTRYGGAGALSDPVDVAEPGAERGAPIDRFGNVNPFGPGGYPTGDYSAASHVTTLRPGLNTDIPDSVPINEFFASYWAKEDPQKMRFGVRGVALPEAIRRQLGKNTGVFVKIVIHGTPAERGGVLEGDVISKIAGEAVLSPSAFDGQLGRLAGKTVDMEVVRDGMTQEISVRLNAD